MLGSVLGSPLFGKLPDLGALLLKENILLWLDGLVGNIHGFSSVMIEKRFPAKPQDSL